MQGNGGVRWSDGEEGKGDGASVMDERDGGCAEGVHILPPLRYKHF